MYSKVVSTYKSFLNDKNIFTFISVGRRGVYAILLLPKQIQYNNITYSIYYKHHDDENKRIDNLYNGEIR